jgi:N-acyl-L-homoserine lactone synthetase
MSQVTSLPADGVAALDRLAEQLLAAVPELRVVLAQTDAERAAIGRLRHRQVTDSGWAKLEGDMEWDAYDERALQVGAWDAASSLVGAMRVVLPAPGVKLPVEDAFAVDVKPCGAVVEAGRLVITPECRGDPAHRAWGALFARSWLELRARGYSLLAGAASPRMVRRLREVGLPFETLGEARPFWGEDRHPVRLDPAGGAPRWFGD